MKYADMVKASMSVEVPYSLSLKYTAGSMGVWSKKDRPWIVIVPSMCPCNHLVTGLQVRFHKSS